VGRELGVLIGGLKAACPLSIEKVKPSVLI
jgi:hypothetical protein